ncbi:MAG TPA: beta-propeller domain-containing protein [Nitrososphaera sp.]|jgi:uncharacterized secreted protein with C-terminal beta-propeller domain
MARNSMFGMAGIGVAAAIGFVFVLSSLGNTLIPQDIGGPETLTNGTSPAVFDTGSQALKKFGSVDELRTFLTSVETNRNQYTQLGSQRFELALDSDGAGVRLPSGESSTMPPSPTSEPSADGNAQFTIERSDLDYSTTNVQMEEVDEPDFLKNDDRYIYLLSGERVTIVDAFPAENATIATRIALDIQEDQSLQNMFLNNDTLVIFYQEHSQDYIIQEYDFVPQEVYQPKTHAMLLDVSDRENPRVINDYEISGSYNSARMIGNLVYVVTTGDVYDYRHPIVPLVTEAGTTIARPEIYYFDNPEPYYAFNTITSIDLARDAENPVNSSTFMMNPASTMYVSDDSIYIAYEKHMPYQYYQTNTRDRFFEVVVPLLPADVQNEIRDIESTDELSSLQKWDKISGLLQDTYNSMSESERNQLFEDIGEALAAYDKRIAKENMTTVIHKISIGSEKGINYVARGEVPGRLLNQFSMDENGDRFRVATTSEFYSPYHGSTLYNNVYVLDENMRTVGELEEIAYDESIYSARFVGDRLYLVTFQRMDPLFVIDLSEDDPKVLGELKLPGYSNYLHPYDENHVIGIGKETKEDQYGNVQILGIKVVLFDVSDVQNPELVDEYAIGGPGTESEVLNDHRALLFDRSRNILSIPVSIYPDYVDPRYTEDGRYMEPKVWRGFYVFGTDPEAGFNLRGQIEHFDGTGDGYYYGYGAQGSRSLYIGDVLYTVTLSNAIKMNDLQTLEEINELEIGPTGGIIKYPRW